VELHAVLIVPSAVHLVVPVVAVGHVVVGHDPVLQMTSHAHEFAQLTAVHASVTAQLTRHAPEPHVIAPHAPALPQVKLHDAPLAHVRFWHDIAVGQLTTQDAVFDEHMVPAHALLPWQSIVHV